MPGGERGGGVSGGRVRRRRTIITRRLGGALDNMTWFVTDRSMSSSIRFRSISRWRMRSSCRVIVCRCSVSVASNVAIFNFNAPPFFGRWGGDSASALMVGVMEPVSRLTLHWRRGGGSAFRVFRRACRRPQGAQGWHGGAGLLQDQDQDQVFISIHTHIE